MPINLKILQNSLVVILSYLIISCNKNANEATLFNLLPSSQTKVDFQNSLTEGPNTNILMYEYFYNGGGVATADFNGDGLEDLYFTSNMADNKMYLNKGKMIFEDITEPSGAGGRPGPWKTGVSTVDINADGKMDLYICYSGAMPLEKRMNQFFINQGNNAEGRPLFKDMAPEMGLNTPAFSNQAYFLDYDQDNDLDMLLLNHNPKALPVLNESQTIELIKKDEQFIGVRLFKNNGNHFDDITVGSGISSSSLSYGLGLGISDFNNDGWPDFYVSNDYQVPDYLYINNKNGTFTDQRSTSLGHNSQFSMGNDAADINNDGLIDIFTLDMLPEGNHRQKLLIAPDNYAKFDLNVRSGFGNQYMRNMLQLNNGIGSGSTPRFSEIGQLAGISNTDWSWSALFADYDADGKKDLFITNGYTRDYTNLDFIKFMNGFVKEKGRLLREDVQQIIEKMPASNVSNYIFSNTNGLTFENKTKNWGMELASNSNGAAYADLDNDGDLDIVVNNVNMEAFIYENQANSKPNHNYLKIITKGKAGNINGIGSKITLYDKGQMQVLEQNPYRGYLSTVSNSLVFGLGNSNEIDSLKVEWPGGKVQLLTKIKANNILTLDEQDAKSFVNIKNKVNTIFSETNSPLNFMHEVNKSNDFSRQPLLISQLSHLGPILKSGDMNNDKLDDLVIGGGIGQGNKVFLQQGNGAFSELKAKAINAVNTSSIADIAIFDVNSDGYNDIYLAHGGYDQLTENDSKMQDQLFLNNGKGDFMISIKSLPKMQSAKSTVEVLDINKDGFLDLFVGAACTPGKYPQPAVNYLLVNNGKGEFINKIDQLAPALKSIGIVKDAKWADLNGKKQNVLIVVGEMTPIMFFENNNGKLQLNSDKYIAENANGFWNTIELADLNNDHVLDIILGNIGTNTQLKATKVEPIEQFYGDFDKNGTLDPILCTYIQGKSYPYITRDEFFMQFAGFKAKFNSFESYADANLETIFDKGEIKNGKRLFADKLETTLLISGKKGKYEYANLPIEAQFSCINNVLLFDYNHDLKTDILLAGNNNYSKIRLGKQDANYGILLRGDGNGGFQYIPQTKSGFIIKGTVNSAAIFGKNIYFGINEKPIVTYKFD